MFYFGIAEIRDGENEYLQRAVFQADSQDEATEKTYRHFAYGICNDDCPNQIPFGDKRIFFENICENCSGDYRITKVTDIREIPQSDYLVLSKYL